MGSLRNFARLDEAEFKTADLHEGLDSTLTLVHHELKNRAVVKKEYGDIPPIRCHPNQLNQVFMNLLVNASQAFKEKGEITIRSFREGDIVNVQISDNGVGSRLKTCNASLTRALLPRGLESAPGLVSRFVSRSSKTTAAGLTLRVSWGKALPSRSACRSAAGPMLNKSSHDRT